ncbi:MULTISPECIES: hypothetical protein [Streptomyces]|uniref:Uncharacterized protein n=1 Tax=Streptomyces doudnae TaxID=3075536 RepID=A0ABD5F2E5_9ACTN|nr:MULTISPECIES: hypothetical protein [unclassified Streptomyces]MDT0440360.1 hypothetical protein [Streptomyces sp. DSM 41981]MYQ68576.1 hypothetical protein [Streptomyces sp. SID4950]SCE47326.1 hypothetical protein GA0115242_13991 [Streptomyces sp. SolWspMP-5a-2]
MLVYEYLPREFIRLGVVSKAAGLDHREMAAQVRLAQERAGSARLAPREPHTLSELLIAELRRHQWERIAHLMKKEGMAEYVPALDVRGARYERQRLQRLVTDVTEAKRSGACVVEIARHRVYRIDARPAASSAAHVPVLTLHLMKASPDGAAEKAWAVHGRDGGLYQRGGYRITSVEQALLEPGELF